MLRFWLFIPLNVLRMIWIALWSMLCISLALVVRLWTGNTHRSLAMARHLWAPGILAIGPFPIEVRGLENVDFDQPCFVAANHQSFLDIPVLFRVLPVNLHFVVKNELSRVPFLSWYIRAMGMIFVDRSNRTRAVESVRRTAELVRGGKTVLLFPEGTRSHDGKIRRLKSGALAAAAQGGVPVVPVVLDGTGRALPGGSFLRGNRQHVRVAIGQPIQTNDNDAEDRRQLAERVYEALTELQKDLLGRAWATRLIWTRLAPRASIDP